jgi:hypothetical protein
VGLVGWTLGLPLLPVRGVIWLGSLIQERVEHEMHDPGVARRQLEEAEEARRKGEISPEKEEEIEREVTSQLVAPTGAEDAPESEA